MWRPSKNIEYKIINQSTWKGKSDFFNIACVLVKEERHSFLPLTGVRTEDLQINAFLSTQLRHWSYPSSGISPHSTARPTPPPSLPSKPETPKFEFGPERPFVGRKNFFFSQQGPTSIKFCHFYFVSVCKRSFLFVSHLSLSHLARCSLVIDQVCGDNESRVRGRRGLHEKHCGLISWRNGKKIFYIIFVP